jgi:hypothetical protein
MLYLISTLNTSADTSKIYNNNNNNIFIQKINFLNEDVRKKMSYIMLDMMNQNSSINNHNLINNSSLAFESVNKTSSLIAHNNSLTNSNSSFLSPFISSINPSGRNNFYSVNDFSLLLSNLKNLFINSKIQKLPFADCYYISFNKIQRCDFVCVLLHVCMLIYMYIYLYICLYIYEYKYLELT